MHRKRSCGFASVNEAVLPRRIPKRRNVSVVSAAGHPIIGVPRNSHIVFVMPVYPPKTELHPAPLTRLYRRLHRIAFLPVLYVQGLFVRWNTVKLHEPAGPREGVIGDGPDLRVLILGDSSAAGVGTQDQSQALSGQMAAILKHHVRLDWQLVARSGDTTPMALDHVKEAAPRPVDLVVVGLGVNDILHGTHQAAWLRQTQDLIDHLTGPYGATHVYLSGIPPVIQFPRLPQPLRWVLGHRAAQFDRALRVYVKDMPHVSMIAADMPMEGDVMSEDGFHPGPIVFTAWANSVTRRVKADLGLS